MTYIKVAEITNTFVTLGRCSMQEMQMEYACDKY